MIVVAAGTYDPVSVGGKRMGGQGDDGNTAGQSVGFDGACDRPAINDRQVHIEKDEVGTVWSSAINCGLPIMSQHDLESASSQEPRKKIPDFVVVFNQQKLSQA